jgi:hypothetical protein
MNAAELVEEIEASFRHVALEDGIGILEAEALDACVGDKAREAERRKDRRKDWESIPDEEIAQHYSVLSFMDQRGLRFHLPAYMRFAVRNFAISNSASIDAAVYALCTDPGTVEKEWVIFTDAQKATITRFLKFMILVAGDKFVDSVQASLAYEGTWSRYDIPQT